MKSKRNGIPRPDFFPLCNWNETGTILLAKFVPCSHPWAGYGPFGHITDTKNETPHFYVYLHQFYAKHSKEWVIVLNVAGYDDYLAQIWKPATEENWKRLVEIYNDLCIPEMFDPKEMQAVGFEW